MMEENKKITEKELQEFAEGCLPLEQDVTVTAGEKKLTFKVYPFISLQQALKIVYRFYDLALAGVENSIEDYNPLFRHYASKFCIVSGVTDLKLPDDVGEAWKILEYTDIYDKVMKVLKASKSPVVTILNACDEMLFGRVDYLRKQTGFDTLLTQIAKSLDGFADTFKDVDTSSVLEVFRKIPEGGNMGDLLKGILNVRDTEDKKEG